MIDQPLGLHLFSAPNDGSTASNAPLPTYDTLAFEFFDDIGAKLIAARVRAGITQRELGKMIGSYSQSTVSQWESDRKGHMRLSLAFQIAYLCGFILEVHLIPISTKLREQAS